MLTVVPEGELQKREKAEIDDAETARNEAPDLAKSTLAGYIRGEFYAFKNQRTQQNIDARIAASLMAYNGQYSAAKMSEIKKFGGSDVYSRVTTVKCRGTTAMLREIFLGNERPWGLKPTPVPDPPPEAEQNINALMAREFAELGAQGMPMPTPELIAERKKQLEDVALKQMHRQVARSTKLAEDKVQDLLVQGGFYDALNNFLIDLPIYPYAVLKGPVVQNKETLNWSAAGEMTTETKPMMFWYRVDPNNVYFTPGASSIEDCTVIERTKLSRTDVNRLVGVPGYDDDALKGVLTDYNTGLRDWIDNYDYQYADEQAKEDPNQNVSELIDALEFHGPVQGKLLEQYGFKDVDDPLMDYYVDAWIIGNYVIKVQLNKNPSKRPIYYISSFEKVPGAVVGHGLPEIIDDIQDVANASFRSLVNNMAFASGPQVALDEERMMPGCNPDEMYPWKRWRFESDPMNASGNQQPPITFFQPKSNASELLNIYQQMTVMADEISAIPRYMTGATQVGGAGSTASGLSMLMGNASKVLQNIAANIDNDVLKPLLTMLYDLVMLTDKTGMLRGDEEIVVQGVGVAAQRETDRMRQLEFLQMTGNPIDMEIMGVEGRASVLRSVADGLGLKGEQTVPGPDEIRRKEQQKEAQMAAEQQALQAQAAMEAGAGGSSNTPAPPPGAGRMGEQFDNAQRTRNM